MSKRNTFLLTLFLTLSSLLHAQNEDLMDMLRESVRFRAESKFDSALLVSQKVATLAEERQSLEYQARSALEMSAVFISTEKPDFALEMCQDAIKYAGIAGLRNVEMTAAYNLGIVMVKYNLPDSAMHYYNLSEEYFRSVNDKDMLGVTLSGLAGIFRNKGQRIKSIEKDSEAASLYEETGQFQYLANRYFWIGEDYLVLNYEDGTEMKARYLDSAEYYYQKSLDLSDSMGFPDPKYQALRGLAVASQRRGRLADALNYMYESNNVTQQLYSNDIEDKVLEYRERYNTAALELEAERQKNRALTQQRSKNIILITGLALIILISIWLYIVDQRRKNIKALAAKNEEINKRKIDKLLQQQEIASLEGILEGQETERKRIALDLHDRLGGILSMVKLHFSTVEEQIDTKNPNKEKFLTASELLDLAAGEVRNISHNLMSGVLAKFGLIPALEDLKSRISETGKLKVNLYTNKVNGSLNGEQELQLYRIVQELMSNILKHAGANEANIQLNGNEGSVNLIVEDDGVGFDPEHLNGKTGIGLGNLKTRVSKLDGTFHIDSGKGAGTTISIDIPIAHD